jgi:hypothetical protein
MRNCDDFQTLKQAYIMEIKRYTDEELAGIVQQIIARQYPSVELLNKAFGKRIKSLLKTQYKRGGKILSDVALEPLALDTANKIFPDLGEISRGMIIRKLPDDLRDASYNTGVDLADYKEVLLALANERVLRFIKYKITGK